MAEFAVRAKVAETPENLKSIKAGDTVWLRWTDEGGGWHQWGSSLMAAKRFSTPDAAKKAAASCPGPWFYKPTPESVEIVQVEYRPATVAIL